MYKSTDILVHRSRFFNAELHSINSIAFNEKIQKAALLRRRIRKFQPSQNDMHSVVEIWNLQNKASFLEQVICDDSDNLALLEDLAWSESGRLFSCGLNTYVNEYDLENGRVKQSNCVNSSPAWCLALNEVDSLLAVGTEDGHICVYSVLGDCFQYEKIVDRNDSRILCVQWYFPAGKHEAMLVGGSIDYIKIWNYRSGRCTDFIKVGNTGVVIWCLKVLPDFTIVSGDSSGTTSFWNGSNCTLNCSFRAHKGDVLAVCASENSSYVYSAGVDPDIIQFNRKSGKLNSWIISTTRRPHTHDVRSLVTTASNCLLSGGVDSFFVQTSLGQSMKNLQIDHLSNFGHKVTTIATDRGNYVFFQYEKFLEMWKMGTPESDLPEHVGGANSVQVTPLKIAENAVRLLEIKSRKSIMTATANSQWIVYANFDNIKVLRWGEETPLQKVKTLHDPIPNISHLCLSQGSRLVLSYGRTVETLKLDQFGVLQECSLQLSGRVSRLVTAADKVVASLADEQKSIVVLSSDSLTQLASFSAPLLPTTVRANCLWEGQQQQHLWLALPNAHLLQYDLNSLKLLRSYTLGKFKSNENSEGFSEYWPIKQLAFGENVVMYSTDHSLYCLQLAKQRITKCNKYQHVAFMDNFGPQEAVLVEVTPQMLISKLPPTIITKTFGT